MMNRRRTWLELGGAALVCTGLLLTGCSKEPEPAPVAKAPAAPPPPPPPPAAPKVQTIADLMDELGIDSRVSLPEDMAPRSTDERIAVLSFLDGFARGDNSVRPSIGSTTEFFSVRRAGHGMAYAVSVPLRRWNSSHSIRQPCSLAWSRTRSVNARSATPLTGL